jgi:hypothetical protein
MAVGGLGVSGLGGTVMIHICRTLAVGSLLLIGLIVSASPETQAREIEQLVQQLGDGRFRVREAAQRKLLTIGRSAVPALRAALTSDDLEVKARARDILRQMQTSIEYLLDELKSGDAATRREAAESLGALGPKARAAIPTLLQLLKDRDESIREAAASALSSIDPENKALAEHMPAQAHVNGKYRKLLKKAKVEADLQSYGRLRLLPGLYLGRPPDAGRLLGVCLPALVRLGRTEGRPAECRATPCACPGHPAAEVTLLARRAPLLSRHDQIV